MTTSEDLGARHAGQQRCGRTWGTDLRRRVLGVFEAESRVPSRVAPAPEFSQTPSSQPQPQPHVRPEDERTIQDVLSGQGGKRDRASHKASIWAALFVEEAYYRDWGKLLRLVHQEIKHGHARGLLWIQTRSYDETPMKSRVLNVKPGFAAGSSSHAADQLAAAAAS